MRLAPQGYKRLQAELLVDGPDLLIQGELGVRVDALCKGRDPLLEARRGLGKSDGHGAGDHVGQGGDPVLDAVKHLLRRQLEDPVLRHDGLEGLEAGRVSQDVGDSQLGLLRVGHRDRCLRGGVLGRGQKRRELAHLL